MRLRVQMDPATYIGNPRSQGLAATTIFPTPGTWWNSGVTGVTGGGSTGIPVYPSSRGPSERGCRVSGADS